MTSYDLWNEATYDQDADNRLRRMAVAKQASEGLWGFLAQSQDPIEYGDRLALAQERIEATAASTGVTSEDLVRIFDQRFASLMEAKSNPFGDDDSDSDDKDDDGDGNTDDDGADADDGDEGDSGGDKDDSDDTDDSDDDPDPDDDDAGQEKDPDHDGDDDSTPEGDTDHDYQAPPFPPPGRSAARYASIMDRIQAGENPLSWGGTPFVGSPARKVAVGADPVSDSNVPQDGGADEGMDIPNALPESSKPRQLPSGGPEAMGTGGGEPLDPALNGGDIQAGGDDVPSGNMQADAQLHRIAGDVHRSNPDMTKAAAYQVARQVVARYYKQAEDLSPLLYGDRGRVQDGPLTQMVKNFNPLKSAPKEKPSDPPESPSDPEPEDKPDTPEPSAPLSGRVIPSSEVAGEGAAASLPELAPLLLL